MSGIIKVEPAPAPGDNTLYRDASKPWWSQLSFFVPYIKRQLVAGLTFFYTIGLVFGLAALSKGEESFVEWANIQSYGLTMWFSTITFIAVFYYMARQFIGMSLDEKPSAGSRPTTVGKNYWLTFFVVLVVILALAGLK